MAEIPAATGAAAVAATAAVAPQLNQRNVNSWYCRIAEYWS